MWGFQWRRVKDKIFDLSIYASPIFSVFLNAFQFNFLKGYIPHSDVIISLLLFASLIASLFIVFSEPRVKSLREKNKKLTEQLSIIITNTENLFNGYLYTFYTDKIVFKHNIEDRLTIYIHDEKKQYFIPCGRYSPSPVYAKKGRPSYPENEGIIGEVWLSGWHYKRYATAKEAREDSLKTYNMPRNTYKNLKLQALFFAGLRVSHDNTNYGLVMFESTDTNRYQEQEIKKILEEQVPYLCSLIQGLKPYIPKPQDATEEGF